MNEQSRGNAPKSDSTNQQSTPAAPRRRSGLARVIRSTLIFLILIGTVAGAGYWFYGVWTQIRVYDARVTAEILSISSRVKGWITDVAVSEGQSVKAGDPLYVIDSRDTKLRLAELAAALNAISAERAQLAAEVRMTDQQTLGRQQASEAELNARQAALSVLATALKQRQADFTRAQSLLNKKVMSRQRWESLRSDLQTARQRHLQGLADVARAKAAIVEAQADRQQVEVVKQKLKSLDFREAQLAAQKQRLQLDIADRTIRAPVDGTIDRTFFDKGEYVQAGQRLLLMHNPKKVWVEANVKETDIRNIKLGGPATVTVDAYPDLVQAGKISRIGNAATSQFALLPTPNPSGNFTKITQRLPVRIDINQVDDLFKPGMMVEVKINIERR